MGMARKIELVAIEFKGKVITFMHGISFCSEQQRAYRGVILIRATHDVQGRLEAGIG